MLSNIAIALFATYLVVGSYQGYKVLFRLPPAPIPFFIPFKNNNWKKWVYLVSTAIGWAVVTVLFWELFFKFHEVVAVVWGVLSVASLFVTEWINVTVVNYMVKRKLGQ